MEINDIFIDDYQCINANDDNEEVIDSFLEDGNKNELQYLKPLVAVYIHKTKTEMFLVMDCRENSFVQIKKICEDWEDRILFFINFGKVLRDQIQYLKYNITILILCKDEKSDVDDNYRFATEKSLNICRKVFLICGDTGEIIDDETIIPFNFDPIKEINNEQMEKLENELVRLLPIEDDILSICDKEKLTPDDKKILQGWLNNDDNNN